MPTRGRTRPDRPAREFSLESAALIADACCVNAQEHQTVQQPDGDAITLLGVAGTADVVANSLSPDMFAAAFAELGIRGWYVPLALRASSARKALRSLPRLGFRGVNVTMPFKRIAAEIAHERSPLVEITGVANTLVIEPNGIIRAEATDGYAVESAIADAGVQLEGASVAIIGAGGAAMEAAWACGRGGAARIGVWNRSPLPAHDMIGQLSAAGLQSTLEVFSSLPIGVAADVLVSCVPAQAFDGVELTGIEAHTVVVDLAYRRDGRPTAVIRAATSGGVTCVDGRSILVRQGAASFREWFGREAPTGAMVRAVTR